jgi:hypothetical protein
MRESDDCVDIEKVSLPRSSVNIVRFFRKHRDTALGRADLFEIVFIWAAAVDLIVL